MMSFIGSLSDELLDDACPRDRAGALVPGVSPRRGASWIGVQAAERLTQRLGRRLAYAAVHPVHHELDRAAGIGRRQHRFVRQKRLNRDVAVVLVVRGKDYPER